MIKRFAVVVMVVAGLIAQVAVAQESKTIKDPAEYNAYIAAYNTQDPAHKAAAMEAFVAQYPASIMRMEALEQARAAYQAAGDVQKLEDMCRLILKDNPNDVQSLALITAIGRNRGTAQSAAEARAQAEKGLQLLPTWKKPEGTSDADFEKVRNQMTIVFNGAAGFGALQVKDYATARNYYMKTIQSVQLDANNVQDVYQLSIADLELNPVDVDGFWYAAKAMNLAGSNVAAANSISAYAKAKYRNYHGSYDGWDQIVAAASSQNAPPTGFSVKPAPTAAELAVQAVQENDVKTLSFSDWEFVLALRDASPANKAAADKVWQGIQAVQKNGAVKLKLPAVKVMSASANTLVGAITEENQESNRADVRVVMEKPMLRPPAAGALVDVIGVISDYTPNPFMFTMERGSVAEAPKAGAPPPAGGSPPH